MLLQDETTANASLKRSVESFPLERPPSSMRRRGPQYVPASLPYFVAGEENRLAALVCGGEIEVFALGNPVLLTGPVGCGKTAIATHLAALAVSQISRDGEPGRVVFYSANDFARSYSEAISADDLKPLSDELDVADVLVIDDLHLMADKPAAQEELALRIESRFDAGLPTILTSKRMPSEVRGIRSRLASRCAPGLTIPIELPQTASRRQLLSELSLHFSLELDENLIAILDAGLESSISVRAMEATMKQISLWCRMNESQVTIEAVQQAIDGSRQSRDLSMAEITNTVSRYFRLRSSELRSDSRKQNLVRARSLAMWLARQLTSNSMHQIGDYFGGRDHTTVLHAIRKTASHFETDPVLKRAADELAEKLS
ncbi:DnaA/Hda family protein [Rubripirellula amarantea]|nr:DnaA/Hda family protein [Rubripirellula amarantea]